jgi:NTP pyrophosphatase (non-canonical NTP hydrolase)
MEQSTLANPLLRPMVTAGLEVLQKEINNWAHRKDFWPKREDCQEYWDYVVATKIGLIGTEVSEAFEAWRCGNKFDDKIPELRSLDVELADAIIRILDLAQELEIDLTRAVIAKMIYNESRPQKHGKDF